MAWSKYHAKRTGKYASQREAHRADELRLLERMGKISDLVEQPRYELVPPSADGVHRGIYYVADFAYVDKESGKAIVEDVKGFKTQLYRLKKRLLLHVHGIEVVEV